MRCNEQVEEQYKKLGHNVADSIQSLSKLNLPEHDWNNEFETRVGKVIGLETAAIKILRKIELINKKEQKAKVAKRIETKNHLKFNRRKIKKLHYQLLQNTDCGINKSKIDKIANETEKMALVILEYYLFDMDKAENNYLAYKSSKFVCFSDNMDSIQHDCFSRY